MENRSTRWCRLLRRRRWCVRTLQTGRHGELSEPRDAGSNRRWRIRGSHDRRSARISSIPDELTSVEAAPLLCAGITTYQRSSQRRLARRRSGRCAGYRWAWASWYPVRAADGFRTVAIGRGREKEKLAKDLGAHVYIDTAVEDGAAVLQRMGGARAILATAPQWAMLWGHWCPVLRPAGSSS